MVFLFSSSALLARLRAVFSGSRAKPAPSRNKLPGLHLSRDLLDFIVVQETGGKAYYDRFLSRPTWPGGQSGVTIAVGYDLGYNSPRQIADDWSEHLSERSVAHLVSVAGIKGHNAQQASYRIHDHVKVPWDSAVEVFAVKTVPRFWELTKDAFPGVDRLKPETQAALLSLVFNRGSSLSGERRKEMAQIRKLVAAGKEKEIPGQIRAMKRLWAGTSISGLVARREREAQLIERALA